MNKEIILITLYFITAFIVMYWTGSNLEEAQANLDNILENLEEIEKGLDLLLEK